MLIIGDFNKLIVDHFVEFGAYLQNEDGEQILLPAKFVTDDLEVGSELRVFVYHDSEGRPIATTEQPVATIGQFKLMRVKDVNATGAFLDWGLSGKDLLVPFREQRTRMHPGRSYIVYIYLDHNSNRVVASAKLDKFLGNKPPRYYKRQKVELLVTQRTELGYKVIVNNSDWGMIYSNEIYTDVNIGETHTGYIKNLRPDGKIDVTLEKIEKIRIDDTAALILQHLRKNGGRMPFTDKSTPEEILKTFNCSKKDFKKALGLLYKNREIVLAPDYVQLTENTEHK